MAEYIVKTDKPIRLDEVLHLHGIHHYSVQRLEKHGRLIDETELVRIADEICRNPLGAILEDVSTIVEATE